METLTAFFSAINGFVWGPPMLVLILGTGLLLQIRLKLMPILRIPTGFRMVWRGRRPDATAEGEISPYAALMTALAATVGTGNIAGVATATSAGRCPPRPRGSSPKASRRNSHRVRSSPRHPHPHPHPLPPRSGCNPFLSSIRCAGDF